MPVILHLAMHFLLLIISHHNSRSVKILTIAPLWHLKTIDTLPTASNGVLVTSQWVDNSTPKFHFRAYLLGPSLVSTVIGWVSCKTDSELEICIRVVYWRMLLDIICVRKWKNQGLSERNVELQCSHSGDHSQSHEEFWTWDGPSEILPVEAWFIWDFSCCLR